MKTKNAPGGLAGRWQTHRPPFTCFSDSKVVLGQTEGMRVTYECESINLLTSTNILEVQLYVYICGVLTCLYQEYSQTAVGRRKLNYVKLIITQDQQNLCRRHHYHLKIMVNIKCRVSYFSKLFFFIHARARYWRVQTAYISNKTFFDKLDLLVSNNPSKWSSLHLRCYNRTSL